MCMVLTISPVYINFYFLTKLLFQKNVKKKINSWRFTYFGRNYIHATLCSYCKTACLVFEMKVIMTIMGTPHSHVKDSLSYTTTEWHRNTFTNNEYEGILKVAILIFCKVSSTVINCKECDKLQNISKAKIWSGFSPHIRGLEL